MTVCPSPALTGRLDHPGQPHPGPQAASSAAGEPLSWSILQREPLPGSGEVPQPGEAAGRASQHPQATVPVPAGPAALAPPV